MQSIAIIANSDKGIETGLVIAQEIPSVELFSTRTHEKVKTVKSISSLVKDIFSTHDAIIFIGSLGICVRTIATHLNNKKNDPAVINLDVKGQFIQSVVSGHVGGANELCEQVARITGGQAIITTASDSLSLWPLDTIHKNYDWTPCYQGNLTQMMASWVNEEPTALLLEVRDKGTNYLESSCPDFVDIFYQKEDIDESQYNLIIAVTPYRHQFQCDSILMYPRVLTVGMGCKQNTPSKGLLNNFYQALDKHNIAKESIAQLVSIDIKSEEPALLLLASELNISFECFSSKELAKITVPNPSEKVFEVTGCYGVAESSALQASLNSDLLIEKVKVASTEGNDFTFAVAFNREYERKGFVEIVGAGPGDPELVTVKGKRLLQQADLILYAGSLVPEELTHYAKPTATVRSSAPMNLEEQFEIMKEFYDRGLLVVRLHTGDPCIYGAIQEQMNYFDEYEMDYQITPGVSSFQAAAARLKSQFTIPEKTQTIILTRGEGRTKMPDSEQLEKLARSQSTMCIFLSATLVQQVQEKLLTHYPADTPVAVCHKLTWKEEKIFRGKLSELAKLVKDNGLTLTTLLVIGEAIDNRKGLSRLYAHEFKHLFR
ncbi:precorrin-4 C(11)-methyltransferase [Puteibacter caeruleilacunae]|nr:precorrin-4 C(11)-methyltransferase [Puteibacter caeruleilacunae]